MPNVIYGEEVTFTAQPDDCCVFSHWIDERKPCEVFSYSNPLTFRVTENILLKPVFKPKKVHVNIVLNYPNLGTTSGSGEYDCGSNIEISASTSCCNQIEWVETELCSSVYIETGEDCECSRVIECTLQNVIEDITIHVKITPGTVNVCTYACPEDGGITGGFQNPINQATPMINGVPCITPLNQVSDCIDAFCNQPIQFMATPNDGFIFVGWKKINNETDSCDVCDSDDEYDNESQNFIESVCEDTSYVACFKKVQKIKFNIHGCNPNENITYTINESGEEQNYSGTFIVDEGDVVHFNIPTNECCVFSYMTINGVELLPYQFTAYEDCTIDIYYENICKTIVMAKDGCIDDSLLYYSSNDEEYEEYEAPIIFHESGEFYFKVEGSDNSCCELDHWNIYNDDLERVSNYYDVLHLSNMNGNYTIEAIMKRKFYTLTIELIEVDSLLSFIILTNDGNLISSRRCSNFSVISIFSLPACENIKIFVSSFKVEYDCSDSENYWIKGKMLDENDNEYQFYHGALKNEEYFTYNNGDFHVERPAKEINVMVLEVNMNGNKTVKIDFSNVDTSRDSNQICYFSECPDVGEAVYDDIRCPFIQNGAFTTQIDDIC